MQALPAFSILLVRTRRRMSPGDRSRLVRVASASYATLTALLLWQALRGQSVVAPDGGMLPALAIWALATVVAGVVAGARRGDQTVAPAALPPLVME